jgi:hypothetical protein
MMQPSHYLAEYDLGTSVDGLVARGRAVEAR